MRSLDELLEEAERMEREIEPVLKGERYAPNIAAEQLTMQVIDLTKIVVRMAKTMEGKT